MKLLDDIVIARKIKRIAIQILEQNYNEEEIVLAGINNNGSAFAKLLFDEISLKSKQKITLTKIRLNPSNPLNHPVEIDLPIDYFTNKNIVIIDDVANTGRTIFYAMKPLLEILPKKIEVAVLVDRKHKSFPILVDYVGLSLATTLQENIDVKLNDKNGSAVFLN